MNVDKLVDQVAEGADPSHLFSESKGLTQEADAVAALSDIEDDLTRIKSDVIRLNRKLRSAGLTPGTSAKVEHSLSNIVVSIENARTEVDTAIRRM